MKGKNNDAMCLGGKYTHIYEYIDILSKHAGCSLK